MAVSSLLCLLLAPSGLDAGFTSPAGTKLRSGRQSGAPIAAQTDLSRAAADLSAARAELGGGGGVGVVQPTRLPALEDEAAAAPAKPSFSLRAQLWAETVGTGLLTLAISCIGAQETPLAPLGVVSMLVALIYTFDPISGAIYSPAVSLALRLRGRMSARTAAIFTAAQVGGATAAATLGRAIYGSLAVPTVAEVSLYGWLRAGLAEVSFTFAIVSVVLFVATTRLQEDNPLKGLIIGMAVFGSALSAGGASGACFNPAIALGLYVAKAITGGGALHTMGHLLLYSLGPCLGAALAYLVFRQVFPDEP